MKTSKTLSELNHKSVGQPLQLCIRLMAASDWLTACDTFECVLVRLGRHVNFLEYSTDVNDALNGLKSFKLKRRI